MKLICMKKQEISPVMSNKVIKIDFVNVVFLNKFTRGLIQEA